MLITSYYFFALNAFNMSVSVTLVSGKKLTLGLTLLQEVPQQATYNVQRDPRSITVTYFVIFLTKQPQNRSTFVMCYDKCALFTGIWSFVCFVFSTVCL